MILEGPWTHCHSSIGIRRQDRHEASVSGDVAEPLLFRHGIIEEVEEGGDEDHKDDYFDWEGHTGTTIPSHSSPTQLQVSFAPVLSTCRDPPENSTHCNTNDRWYSAVEFRQATVELQSWVLRWRYSSDRRNQTIDDDSDELLRGLEDMISIEALQDREHRQANVWKSVMDAQQQEQQDEGLAQVSRQASLVSRTTAWERAQQDAIAVDRK